MLIQDLRYAIRGLLHRPGFAIVTIATLAIGIGANAAIFGAVNAVLLRPLPFPEPDRLTHLFKSALLRPDSSGAVAPPDFVDWRRDNSVFTELAGINADAYPIAEDGPAEQVPGARVTGGFFDVLGVTPLHGRTMQPVDDAMGGPDVVVLGAALWRRRYGSDPGVVGRRIIVDGVSREVIGVMPEGFSYPLGSEVWLPQRFTADDIATQRGAHYLDVIGRLKPGVTVEEAHAAMWAMGERLAKAYPRTNRDYRVSVRSMRDSLVGDTRLSLVVLLSAVGLVLLIVCVNVAGLLLTRSMGRGRELAIRAAVGAGRGRLVRGLLAESLVIAAAGGAGGLALAWWGTSTIASLDSGTDIPFLDQTRLDATVVLFTALTSLFAVVLFGTVPAWKASVVGDVAQRMRTEATHTTSDPSSQRMRGALIVVQTAVAVVLLIGAALLVRSFVRLLEVERGFELDGIQTFAITLPQTRYETPPQRAAFVEELVARIAQRPDVVSAGAIFGLPFQGFRFGISTSTIDGRKLSDDEHDRLTFQIRLVTPDYFRTVGMPLVRGRSIAPADRVGTEPVAVLSETAAKLLWPDQDPLEHHFTIGTRMGQGGANAGGTIVGLVRDIHDLQPGLPVKPMVYLSHAQFPIDGVSIVARSRGEPAALVEPMRALLADLDPNVPMYRVRTMEQLGAAVVSRPRLHAVLLGSFAIVAVFLSALGLYGMLAYLVSQRTREIAIRLALGAERRTVVGMVVGRAGWLAASGVAIGCIVALIASRFVERMLFGVSGTDVMTYVAVAAGALVIALVASWLPARRAMRVDPTVALRAD